MAYKYLLTFEFAEPARTQTTGFWYGSRSSRSQVRFELYIFFVLSILVRFGFSPELRVLIRFVRFAFDSVPVSAYDFGTMSKLIVRH